MTSMRKYWAGALPAIALLLSAGGISGAAGHPRPSYENVRDIDAMAAALRKSLAQARTNSYSRAWWVWDRLRCRYVDHGRKDKNALKILRAAFLGGILDRHRKLEAKGEGDLFYLFFTTLRSGKREAVLVIDGRKLFRDVHGGGYHGSWGGAARMRIYEELARAGMLTVAEKDRFKKIVHQSFRKCFIDFQKGHQVATNHAFGNAGGPAMALRLFPGGPQANEAKAWIDRVWNHFVEFGDWKEWTYYPYGPIFLHGMIDLAEAAGAVSTQRRLLYAVGRRCLGFVHGGGVRGNPNSGANATFPTGTDRQKEIYANPWNRGYYRVETESRDGHFWYRLAQHFKDAEFLWAAEQVLLGGRPPGGKVPPAYLEACDRRFAWFNERGIKPKVPAGRSAVGYISARKHKIPERLYLCPSRRSGQPFASFFIYDGRGSHLCSNATGRLYEYCVDGAKLLGTAGKYNSGHIRQGGYDSMLVIDPKLKFPVNDKGITETSVDRGGKIIEPLLRAENQGDDSFGQFGFTDYFGAGSRWTRQTVLTAEGYLVVRDVYVAGKQVDGFQAGPCWLLRPDAAKASKGGGKSWFDAPAWDHAWWQKRKKRVLVYIHPAEGQTCGVARHATSADISRAIKTNNSYARATVKAGRPRVFLSVLVPHDTGQSAQGLVKRIKTALAANGDVTAEIGRVKVSVATDGSWRVRR